MTQPNNEGETPIDAAIRAEHGDVAAAFLSQEYKSITDYVLAKNKERAERQDKGKQPAGVSVVIPLQSPSPIPSPTAGGGGGDGGGGVGNGTGAKPMTLMERLAGVVADESESDDGAVYVGEDRDYVDVYALPPELLHDIFTYLDPPALGCAEATCRLWRIWAGEDDLWKLFTQRDDWNTLYAPGLRMPGHNNPLRSARTGALTYKEVVSAAHMSMLRRTQREQRAEEVRRQIEELQRGQGSSTAIVVTYFGLAVFVVCMFLFLQILWPLKVDGSADVSYGVVVIPFLLAIAAANSMGIGSVFIAGNTDFLNQINERTSVAILSGTVAIAAVMIAVKVDGAAQWSWPLVLVPVYILVAVPCILAGVTATVVTKKARRDGWSLVAVLSIVVAVFDAVCLVVALVLAAYQLTNGLPLSWFVVAAPVLTLVVATWVYLVLPLKGATLSASYVAVVSIVAAAVAAFVCLAADYGDRRIAGKPVRSFIFVTAPLAVLQFIAYYVAYGTARSLADSYKANDTTREEDDLFGAGPW